MNNSSLNTGLLLVLVVALVAGFWYFSSQKAQEEENTRIEVTLPGGSDNSDNQ